MVRESCYDGLETPAVEGIPVIEVSHPQAKVVVEWSWERSASCGAEARTQPAENLVVGRIALLGL